MTIEATSTVRSGRPRRVPGWWPGALAWGLWALAMMGIAGTVWFDHLLRQAGRTDLLQFTASATPYALAVLSGTAVGTVLATRQPRHPVGWLLLGLGLALVASGLPTATRDTGSWPGPGRSRPLTTSPCTPPRASSPGRRSSASRCC